MNFPLFLEKEGEKERTELNDLIKKQSRKKGTRKKQVKKKHEITHSQKRIQITI